MNHEAAASYLPDLLHGRLTGDRMNAVASHAETCDECQALGEAYRSMMFAFHAPSDDGHPSSEELTAWVMGAVSLDLDRRSQIAAHVRDCASCRMDSEAVRGAEAETGARPLRDSVDASKPRRGLTLPGRSLLVAAAILVALLAYPAYLGIAKLLQPEMESVASAAAPRPQLVSMVLLQAPLRGDAGSAPVIDIAPDQSGAVLAIDPSALIEFDDETPIRFRVSTESIDLLMRDVIMRDLRAGIRETGLATLWVPESEFAAGPHVLHVSYGSNDGSWSELFESRFDVNRPSIH